MLLFEYYLPVGSDNVGVVLPKQKRAPKRGVDTKWCILLFAQPKIISMEIPDSPSVHQMMESVIGCKWSLTVIDLVRRGVHRQGAMEHAIDGLSAKVLNERLVKLVRFGILEKTSFAEVPPRVEYHMTPFGREFSALLDQVDLLEKYISTHR